jgi:tetratricopeptide (TPR) repeat protein
MRRLPLRRLAFAASLLLTFSSFASDKSDTWVEARTEHFTVLTNAGEKQARHVAYQLERMRLVFKKAFSKMTVDPSAPITVLAVKDQKGFRALEPAAYLAKGQLTLAGLFLHLPDKNYILLRLDATEEHPFATVYHEYTHMLLSRADDWIPLWLNEGVAEFYQNTDIQGKDVMLGQPSKDDILWLRQNKLLPLPALLTVDHNSPYYHEENKGSIFYAESWALTHYLMVKGNQEDTDILASYVNLITQGVDSQTAATRTFGDLKKLQSALELYIAQSKFSQFRMSGVADVDESKFEVQTIPNTKADAVRADFLAYNDRPDDARALIDQVLKDDPNNALAYETLGYLSLKEGHNPEALHYYEQAVKANSQSYLAQYYFATLSINAGKIGTDDARIESSLRAAMKLNPAYAPAPDALAAFFSAKEQNLDEAHMLTLQAVQLDPTNVNYRIHAASILLEMQRTNDAVAVLNVAAKIAKTPQDQASVQNMLNMAGNTQAREEAEAQREKDEGSADLETAKLASGETASASNPAFRHEHSLSGPRKQAKGVIRGVTCGYPATMDFKLNANGQSTPFHSDNYYKIAFSAVNFSPEDDLKPCSDIEGLQAQVEFVQPTEKDVPGQVVGIELTK